MYWKPTEHFSEKYILIYVYCHEACQEYWCHFMKSIYHSSFLTLTNTLADRSDCLTLFCTCTPMWGCNCKSIFRQVEMGSFTSHQILFQCSAQDKTLSHLCFKLTSISIYPCFVARSMSPLPAFPGLVQSLECIELFDVDIFQLFHPLLSPLSCQVLKNTGARPVYHFRSCCGLSFHNNYIDERMPLWGEHKEVHMLNVEQLHIIRMWLNKAQL